MRSLPVATSPRENDSPFLRNHRLSIAPLIGGGGGGGISGAPFHQNRNFDWLNTFRSWVTTIAISTIGVN